MSDKEIKMGDVFNLPVEHNIDICKVTSERGSVFVSAEVTNLKHVCLAINSYDNHVETIRQQQEVIDEMASLLRDIGGSNCRTSEFYDECNGILSKLNGGEE